MAAEVLFSVSSSDRFQFEYRLIWPNNLTVYFVQSSDIRLRTFFKTKRFTLSWHAAINNNTQSGVSFITFRSINREILELSGSRNERLFPSHGITGNILRGIGVERGHIDVWYFYAVAPPRRDLRGRYAITKCPTLNQTCCIGKHQKLLLGLLWDRREWKERTM